MLTVYVPVRLIWKLQFVYYYLFKLFIKRERKELAKRLSLISSPVICKLAPPQLIPSSLKKKK